MLLPSSLLATASDALVTIQASPSSDRQTLVAVALLVACLACLVTMGAMIFVIMRGKRVVKGAGDEAGNKG
ncbi:hypothetical protein E4U41_004244 [Claviceps citrina]|nr:hypothetical protein E4U41_004244 [Claviceps citrina]